MVKMDSMLIAFLHTAVKPIKGQMKHFDNRYQITGTVVLIQPWVVHKELKQGTVKIHIISDRKNDRAKIWQAFHIHS